MPDAAPAIPVAALAARVGEEIGLSRWFVIDQARIDAFAEATEDRYFIHTEPERAARESPFGVTIGHGFLSLSLLSAMNYDALPPVAGKLLSLNYGLDRVRFVSPVKVGSRVRGRFRLAALDEVAPRTFHATYDVTVEIEHEAKPALVARWIGRFVIA